MKKRAVLALEDGKLYCGEAFGANQDAEGEVVFATCMTGYQEICSDPSYHGQMVVLTFPLIGNYGISAEDRESRQPWLAALLVRDYTAEYSNWRAGGNLHDYLAEYAIPGLSGIDTRSLTRHLRTNGTKRAVLRQHDAEAILGDLDEAALVQAAQAVSPLSDKDLVGEVCLPHATPWNTSGSSIVGGQSVPDTHNARVVLLDCGFKENIARCLAQRGLEVVILPYGVSTNEILALAPAGIVISNGPGDPEVLTQIISVAKELIPTGIPLMGICLGHQIIGLAAGGRTSRLSYGHHGANHPVQDLVTGRVSITSHNHNFQVDASSIPAESGFRVSLLNLTDGSVEGLAHESLPILSIQYHPEASPGPHDNLYHFDRFTSLVRTGK